MVLKIKITWPNGDVRHTTTDALGIFGYSNNLKDNCDIDDLNTFGYGADKQGNPEVKMKVEKGMKIKVEVE